MGHEKLYLNFHTNSGEKISSNSGNLCPYKLMENKYSSSSFEESL